LRWWAGAPEPLPGLHHEALARWRDPLGEAGPPGTWQGRYQKLEAHFVRRRGLERASEKPVTRVARTGDR
jgi:hypothetical protein